MRYDPDCLKEEAPSQPGKVLILYRSMATKRRKKMKLIWWVVLIALLILVIAGGAYLRWEFWSGIF
jgi:hypothetical protein